MELLSYLKYLKLGVYFILLVGISSHILVWMDGLVEEREGGIKKFLRGIFFRVPFQTGIMKLGLSRWTAHFLIFLSFLWFLFFYWFPWVIKSSGLNEKTVFVLHDLFSLALFSGISIAFLRRFFSRKDTRGEFEDFYSLSMLFGIWLSGFLLQISKIQSIEKTARKGEFFLGKFGTWLFDNMGVNLSFVPLLYIHVMLVLIFVASIPWTKMIHILMLPLKEVFGRENAGN